jgi:hypothetical protein
MPFSPLSEQFKLFSCGFQFGLTSWGATRDPPAEYTFQSGHKVRCSDRPACSFGPSQFGEVIVRVGTEEVRKVGDAIKHRTNRDQLIVLGGQMARTLDHFQSSARAPRPARTGFRLTYRTARSK